MKGWGSLSRHGTAEGGRGPARPTRRMPRLHSHRAPGRMSEFAAGEPVGPTEQPVRPTELPVQPTDLPVQHRICRCSPGTAGAALEAGAASKRRRSSRSCGDSSRPSATWWPSRGPRRYWASPTGPSPRICSRREMWVWRPPHPRRHSFSERSVLSGSRSSCWPNSTRYRPRSAASPSAPGCTSRVWLS